MLNFLKGIFRSKSNKSKKSDLHSINESSSKAIKKTESSIDGVENTRQVEKVFEHISLKKRPELNALLYSIVLEFKERIDDYYWFSDGLIVVSDPKTNLKGFMDKEGNIIIEPKFIRAKPFNCGFASVTTFDEKLEKYLDGIIDKTGNLIIDYLYESIGDFKDGLAIVSKSINAHESVYSYIDINGNELPDTKKYNRVSNFSNGLAAVQHIGKWGYIDTKGKVIIPFMYNNANYFKNGVAWVTNINDELGIINTRGEQVLPFINKKPVGIICEDIILVLSEKKYGYINTRGEEIVPCKYQKAGNFNNGLAAVLEYISGDWSFIDKTGNIVIEDISDAPEYWEPSFSEGFSSFCREKQYGFINVKGEIVVPAIYSSVGEVQEGLVYVENEFTCGFLKMQQ